MFVCVRARAPARIYIDRDRGDEQQLKDLGKHHVDEFSTGLIDESNEVSQLLDCLIPYSESPLHSFLQKIGFLTCLISVV